MGTRTGTFLVIESVHHPHQYVAVGRKKKRASEPDEAWALKTFDPSK